MSVGQVKKRMERELQASMLRASQNQAGEATTAAAHAALSIASPAPKRPRPRGGWRRSAEVKITAIGRQRPPAADRDGYAQAARHTERVSEWLCRLEDVPWDTIQTLAAIAEFCREMAGRCNRGGAFDQAKKKLTAEGTEGRGENQTRKEAVAMTPPRPSASSAVS